MRNTQWLSAAILIGAISGAPQFAAAMGESSPTPPQSSQPSGTTTTKHKTKKEKSSSAEDFLAGYHAAYALIYDKGDYVGGSIEPTQRLCSLDISDDAVPLHDARFRR